MSEIFQGNFRWLDQGLVCGLQGSLGADQTKRVTHLFLHVPTGIRVRVKIAWDSSYFYQSRVVAEAFDRNSLEWKGVAALDYAETDLVAFKGAITQGTEEARGFIEALKDVAAVLLDQVEMLIGEVA